MDRRDHNAGEGGDISGGGRGVGAENDVVTGPVEQGAEKEEEEVEAAEEVAVVLSPIRPFGFLLSNSSTDKLSTS